MLAEVQRPFRHSFWHQVSSSGQGIIATLKLPPRRGSVDLGHQIRGCSQYSCSESGNNLD